MANTGHRTLSLPAIVISFVVFFSTTTAQGQSSNAEKVFRDSVKDELRELKSELKNVLEKLDRIERTMQNSAQASEFSPVEIKVISPDGQPLSGAMVRLFSKEQGQREISVSGTSGDDGIAFARQLPYGKYNLRVDTADGWYAFGSNLNVELGAGLKLTVQAPVPDQWANVTFQSDFSSEPLEGLVFGERRRYHSGNSYTTSGSPEPGEEVDRLRKFPTIGRGITKVAARIGVAVQQEIEQPNGAIETWTWKPDGENGVPTLLFMENEVLQVESSDQKTFTARDESDFFQENSSQRIAYSIRNVRPLVGGEAVFKVPAGNVEVRLVELLGRASDDVVSVISEFASDDTDLQPGSVWLTAMLEPESEWYSQTFDLSTWDDDAGFYASDATQKLTVLDGDKKTVALTSR